ncbi:MAG: UTP--glucose-1-phosphate uridylyltransferase [Clostridia bacterium]|nr:UTP--glucose-1-phosphate uridylyltransferase [Clostridia bacterium]
MVKKAVIPCGGFGTRFLPATKIMPKELLPIVDKPALSYIVDEAVASGITDILIILSNGKEVIKKLFEPNERLNAHLLKRGQQNLYDAVNKDCGAKVTFAIQKEQKGSGDAIYLAKEFANGEPFAVLFGDDVIYSDDNAPAIKQLIDVYDKTGVSVVGVQRTSEEVARRCGVMEIAEEESDITKITGIIEKPTGELPSSLVSLGRFVLTADIFEQIEKTPLAKDGEVYLTTAIGDLAKEKGAVACVFKGRRYDIGNKEGYLEAVVEYALRNGDIAPAFDKYLKEKK